MIDYTSKKKDKELIDKKGKCRYCGCDYKPFLNIDHIIPLSRGGANDSTNKQVTCKNCNLLKGMMTHKEFALYRRSLETMIELGKIQILTQGNISLKFIEKGIPPEEWQKKIGNIKEEQNE